MNCEIIAVGTELLLGQISNTNASFLSRKMSGLGINVFFHTVVGDNPERLTEALKIASERADIIITTGGLGPTSDDLTKETIAEFCGRKCVKNQEILEKIRTRFAARGNDMPKSNEKQAELPEGCIVLQNNHGTAPGAVIETEKNTFIMLPGPPSEMMKMYEESLESYLKVRTGGVIHSKTLRVFGIGESAVEEKLSEIMKSQSNPTIAPYAKTGEVTLRLTARAEDEKSAAAMLEPLERSVRGILGDFVYGEGDGNSLENVVCHLLRERGLTLATAESCTGGMLGSKITSISGASECFECGVVTYSNEQKIKLIGVKPETLEQFGAVSPQTAAEMAQGVRALGGADIGIGITGIAGPGGGSAEKPVGLVYIAVSAEGVSRPKRFVFTGDRNFVRTQSAMSALDMVRRQALGLELP